MNVAGFIKTSLLDWDGCIAATVYLSGCDFRCPFCHNPDLVMPGRALDDIAWEDVEAYLRDNSDFLDGVVFSGGEPTLSPFLHEMVKRVRSLGLKVKLDTNGCMPEVLDDLIGAGLVDFVSMDVKAPLDERYDQLCGVPGQAEAVRRSAEVLISSGIDHEFRTTVVPIYLKQKDIEDIARSLQGAKRFVLQQFRPKITLDQNLGALDPLPGSALRSMAEAARRHVPNVKVRGI